jgi:apolipoprotein N-acyltransferase
MARKTGKEARAERITWFAMILVFLPMSFPNVQMWDGYITCGLLGLILLVSGVYQKTKRWQVSPLTWVIMTFLFIAAGADWYFNRTIVDLNLVGLGATFAVILVGILTNES